MIIPPGGQPESEPAVDAPASVTSDPGLAQATALLAAFTAQAAAFAATMRPAVAALAAAAGVSPPPLAPAPAAGTVPDVAALLAAAQAEHAKALAGMAALFVAQGLVSPALAAAQPAQAVAQGAAAAATRTTSFQAQQAALGGATVQPAATVADPWADPPRDPAALTDRLRTATAAAQGDLATAQQAQAGLLSELGIDPTRLDQLAARLAPPPAPVAAAPEPMGSPLAAATAAATQLEGVLAKLRAALPT